MMASAVIGRVKGIFRQTVLSDFVKVSENCAKTTTTTPHSHSGGRLVSLVTFENAGASLVLLLVLVTHPTTVGRGRNFFKVTFELVRPV